MKQRVYIYRNGQLKGIRTRLNSRMKREDKRNRTDSWLNRLNDLLLNISNDLSKD